MKGRLHKQLNDIQVESIKQKNLAAMSALRLLILRAEETAMPLRTAMLEAFRLGAKRR